MANNSVGVAYHRLHHFLTEAPWSATQINQRRPEVMNKCSRTGIGVGFTLILDDSGHRKSGNFTGGVGRQYLGEIGKTDRVVVVVTTHLYDGKKSLPLDLELYQPASSLLLGKEDEEFKKKPELGLELIDRSLQRKYRPKIVLIDAGYGNNTPFLKELEKRNLKYLGGLAKNRKVIQENESGIEEEISLEELTKSLTHESFTPVTLSIDKPKTVYVFFDRVADDEGERTFAIVMNASSWKEATDIDYFITNIQAKK